MRNPFENPNEHEAGGEPITEDHRYPCACQDPTCWCDDRDPTNVRVGTAWYAEGCGLKHPVHAGTTDPAFQPMRDEMNERRR